MSSVFLRSSSKPASRKRRSVESMLEELANKVDYGFGPKPKTVHSFWKRLKREMPSRSITWNSPRSKRNIPEHLANLGPQDFENELEEMFHPEVEHLHQRTVRETRIEAFGQEAYEMIMESQPEFFHRVRRAAKHQTLSRRKRSTEAELLEMSMSGSVEATVTAVTDTSVTFSPPELPAGDYNVIVVVAGAGHADAAGSVLTSQALADTITPSQGSIYGGQTVVIAGNGFSGKTEDTSVAAGTESCQVEAVTAASVTCVTPAGADGSVDFVVTSGGVEFPAVSFTYDSATATPTVATVTPASGTGAQSLTIDGDNFGSSPVVTVGATDCVVTASTSSSISCDLPAVAGGDYAVVVLAPEFGLSNSDVTYESELTASSMSPLTGSFGGGSLLTITGTGFDTETDPTVTVCSADCAVESVTDTEIQCRTPANSGSVTEDCAVSVSQASGKSVDLADSFTYDDSLTPQVASVSPQRGGTGGGTSITITGTGFAASGNKVMIDGSECDITSESETSITCLTNSHDGCIEVAVTVEVPGAGYGQVPDDGSANFYYIDRWNSIWTWGGTGTPLVDEFIVITAGQTILLDTSTPILAFVLIDGGKLMYDREADGLNLQSKYILIINGGALEIGTEDEPYLNQASITMHGNVR